VAHPGGGVKGHAELLMSEFRAVVEEIKATF
jgi:hypothetical protein